MKDYMKSGFEEYADELNTNLKSNPKNIFKNNLRQKDEKRLNDKKNKVSLNSVYEMATDNASDYSTETLEKLE